MPADLTHVSSFPQGQGGLGAVEGRGVGFRKHKQAREGGYGAEDSGTGGGVRREDMQKKQAAVKAAQRCTGVGGAGRRVFMAPGL